MASVETKTEAVINDEENDDADNGDEVTDDGKAVVAKKSKKKKKPKKPSKLKECASRESVKLFISSMIKMLLSQLKLIFELLLLGSLSESFRFNNGAFQLNATMQLLTLKCWRYRISKL